METGHERRTEKRLRYCWPIWFSEDFDGMLSQGQMVDVSSRGAAFTCYADEARPHLGQNLTARFSIPRYGPDSAFDMTDVIRSANVCRVESSNGYLCRIAVQFAEALPFKPGEQPNAEDEAQAEEAEVLV